jgi:Flp pilus assembly pilin Flp
MPLRQLGLVPKNPENDLIWRARAGACPLTEGASVEKQQFWSSDSGTDMVEYTLLLAFIALACAAAMLSIGPSIDTLWSVSNRRLSSAAAS